MGSVPINAGIVIPLNAAGDGTTAAGFRHALATLLQQSSPGVATPGRLGANHFVVSGRSDMAYNVSAGGVVLTRSAEGAEGAYLVGIHKDVVVATSSTDGINPRYDRVYVHQPDPALDGTAVDVRAVVAVASGNPAASPTLPPIPAGALELARLLVPATATRTESIAVTKVPDVVGLNVGIIPVNQGGTGASTPAAARRGLGLAQRQSGTASGSSGTVAPGEDVRLLNFRTDFDIPADATLHVHAQVELLFPASQNNFAGVLHIGIGPNASNVTRLVQRRWESHNRNGRSSTWAIELNHQVTSPISAGSYIWFSTTADAGSEVGLQVWDAYAAWSVY